MPDADAALRTAVMRLAVAMLAASSLIALCATVAAAQAGKGVVRVEGSDSSGGRVPGVAVVATAVDGRVVTAGTGPAGRCVFPAVPGVHLMVGVCHGGCPRRLVRVSEQGGAQT